MSIVRNLVRCLRRLRSERGQMLIIIGLVVIPISMLLAAVAVDASMWQSERRGAQKDADLAALAGALELARPDQGDAAAAAMTSLTQNDEAGNGGSDAGNVKNLIVDGSCFNTGKNDAVTVDVNHESQTFFSSIFGLKIAPDIGAHAKACAGATQAPNGLVPIETDLTGPCFTLVNGEYRPKIAQPCGLDFGAQHSNPRGILDLQASGDYCSDATGSGDLEDLIEWGATGSCMINETGSCDPTKNGPWYDCVAVQNGNPTKVGRAFRDRIAREGACDTDGDGIEEFDEVVTLAFDSSDDSKDIYEPRDCDPNTDGLQMSPRLITIIVLPAPPSSGNNGYPIYAFAGMYVEGCNQDGDSNAGLDPKCDVPGGSIAPTSGGTHYASMNLAPPCGKGKQPTCTPTPTYTATNTPMPNTPTRTPTPTNTPGGPTPPPTATATSSGGGGGGGAGHLVTWGRMVNLIFAGKEAGPPTSATTLFSISLVQ